MSISDIILDAVVSVLLLWALLTALDALGPQWV